MANTEGRQLSPAQTADRAGTAVRSRLRQWLTDPIAAQTDSVSIGLHPPTERLVAVDPDAARAWVRLWQNYTGPGVVDWEPRRWPSFGTQDVPVRLRLTGVEEICRSAGAGARWQRLRTRRDALAALAAPEDFPAVVAKNVKRWESLSDTDFTRLLATASWLLAHPESGLLIRQLPIEGVDTKWLAAHRGLVDSLVLGATGSTDLGIRTLPSFYEIALLDDAILPGMPRVFAATIDSLAALPVAPSRVVILENREGVHALPPIADTIALHGGGNAVTSMAHFGWLADADVVYWGDLDTHGFVILDRLRRRLPHVRSLLMDPATFHRWTHLAIPEPAPATEAPTILTATEQQALADVRAASLRLEQERIPWTYVLERLAAAGLAPT
ncbi:DUF2220 family protein [Gordonia alkaliphila]|uniref:DUF3322 domain-containing protein n=1 Tax=Gordonia alkaliphila TaxID=1053547 RepID=UPI001FF1A3ED|nr:Wadjet anti-phage system protein JetD domain-containing protein [Gordonia alkaliphila]MCK0439951.1 DUF2220 family protein [Gordonia alkaliphila]